MRRSVGNGIVIAAGIVLLMNTFQTAAAAPYTYGCSPVSAFVGSTEGSSAIIYNGSAATANLIVKALAFNGTNLNSALGITTNVALGATQTKWISWTNPSTVDPAVNATIPSTLRIVSDQPIEAEVDVTIGTGLQPVPCLYLHP
jgi:hypothetical protein